MREAIAARTLLGSTCCYKQITIIYGAKLSGHTQRVQRLTSPNTIESSCLKCLFIGTRYRVQIDKHLKMMSYCLNAWLSVHDGASEERTHS